MTNAHQIFNEILDNIKMTNNPPMNQPIDEKWKEVFVEAGANIEHDRWARWQKYMFSKGVVGPDGVFHLPKEFVDRWFRQIDTPYSELSEAEKESDRKESRNYLPIIENLLEQEKRKISEAVKEKQKTVRMEQFTVDTILSIINK